MCFVSGLSLVSIYIFSRIVVDLEERTLAHLAEMIVIHLLTRLRDSTMHTTATKSYKLLIVILFVWGELPRVN